MIEEMSGGKIAPDDPRRCQGTYANGQCNHQAAPNSIYCTKHGATREELKLKRQIMRQYNVAKWQSRIEHFSDHDSVKTLRDEIGIIRMLLETIMNQCHSDMELLLFSSKISDLVSRIESLVRNCHRLESQMGQLLDKAAALQLSGEIVEIIGMHIDDEEVIKSISADIAAALVRMENE